MKWIKRGLIYQPDGNLSWGRLAALTPTPILLNEEVIRIYAGFRDDQGVSRIGYVEVKAANPSRVIGISPQPALDIGAPGTFDDNGVILGDVIKHNGSYYLYYVAFQLVKKAKFYAFSGLAISADEGRTFNRVSQVPVLDRTDGELFIRAIHSVMLENGVWKFWYAAGNGWEQLNGTPYPRYHIRYVESLDGRSFSQPSVACVEVQNDEYRIGRPRVYQFADRYLMFYTSGSRNGDYLAGCAESDDGVSWTRMDGNLGIAPSASGWDSLSLCYPALLECHGKTYMFYNGNNMGQTGFGYAELEAW